MTDPIEPIPRSLMAALVAAHHYAVRVPPRESPFRWDQDYPKKDDCAWTFESGAETRVAEGSRAIREPPRFQGVGQFRHAAPLFAQGEERGVNLQGCLGP
jgi:hypothetical protein